MCTRKQVLLEALVRHRKSPYLCKVEREGDFSIDVEMISACGYLEAGGVACTLHGRTSGRRQDRQAGPLLRMASQRTRDCTPDASFRPEEAQPAG